MGNNNAWFTQNCDPGQSQEDENQVQSGGGAVYTSSDSEKKYHQNVHHC